MTERQLIHYAVFRVGRVETSVVLTVNICEYFSKI